MPDDVTILQFSVSKYTKLSNGNEQWTDEFDRYHRLDGPAFICHRTKMHYWYRHDELHREDGPAIVCQVSGYSRFSWWYDGIAYTFSEWCNVANKTEAEILSLVLTYGVDYPPK